MPAADSARSPLAHLADQRGVQERNNIYMRPYFIAAMTGALVFATLTFTGCANQNTPPTTAAEGADPGKRTYTQHDLERTGQAQTGQALESADPSIQAPRR